MTGQFLLYRTEDGHSRVECRFEDGSLWLSQAGMAELFATTPQNITQHLKNLYADGELRLTATCKDYFQVREEGARQVQRAVKHYNLDAILAVGYRVRSTRGTQFRQWATARLREYLVKGFAMDDERLKNAGDGTYFDESSSGSWTSAPLSASFTGRSSTSTRPASTTTPARRVPSGSSPRSRTRCTGQPTGIPQRRSSRNGQMRRSRIWA